MQWWRIAVRLLLAIYLSVSAHGQTYCNSSVDTNNVTTPVPGCLTQCGTPGNYQWILASDQSSFFTVVTDALMFTQWSSARPACNSLFGNGADLAVPKSHQDFLIMQSLLTPSSYIYYIGGFQNTTPFSFVPGTPINIEPEGGWQWIDGTSIDMTQNTTRWAIVNGKISYPAYTTAAGCVGIQTGRNGIVELTTCTVSRGFYCSIKCKAVYFASF
jgi:hypothetical protein